MALVDTKVVRRLARIIQVSCAERLDTLIPTVSGSDHLLLRALNLSGRISPLKLISTNSRSDGERLTSALETLGPVFIKFGQLLSTRRDLVPTPMADELARLQDQVPPFSGQQAQAIVERSLGPDRYAQIASFDITPMASASIAQVHTASLTDGSQVVFKIVRPDIEETIVNDLAVLAYLAQWVDSHIEEARLLHLPAVVADYQRTILLELDMLSEAANGQQLRDNFADSPLLYVPRIHHNLTTRNVLVMERMHGIPISNINALHQAGVNIRTLAERGVETFFTQVFVHNFFHADMHPGNIFVDATDPEQPRYIALDCAIIGTLSERDQEYLARNLMAFFNRDYSQVARLHLESGWVPPHTNPQAFEQVIREVCDPIFAKPLNEISFSHFLLQLFETARQFDMEVQPQLILLQKTLLYIEGLGRQLYPQLDLWETAKPFMETWMEERLGPRAALRALAERAPELLQQLPRLPDLMLNASSQLVRLEASVAYQQTSLTQITETVRALNRGSRIRRWTGIVCLSLSALILWNPLSAALSTAGVPVAVGLFAAVAGMVLLIRL